MDSALRIIESNPLNAELPLELLDQSPDVGAPCYVRNHFGIPRVDPDDWRLRIAGPVDDTSEWTLARLRDLPVRTVTMMLECAGNGRALLSPPIPGTPWALGAVSRTTFTGAPLRQLLARVGTGASACEVVCVGLDRGEVAPGRVEPYARGLPLDVARSDDVLVAWEQNGAPLAPEHGAPLRLVVPGWYGMASVKWLSKIRLSDQPFRGYYQNERYVYVGEPGTPDGTPVGHIRVRALITRPTDEEVLRPGSVATVSGVAWAGVDPVTRVEVSTDGGASWEDAALGPDGGAGADGTDGARWGPVRWRRDWRVPDAGGGRRVVMARARDAAGNVQPLASRWNALGYGNNVTHRVTVRVGEG